MGGVLSLAVRSNANWTVSLKVFFSPHKSATKKVKKIKFRPLPPQGKSHLWIIIFITTLFQIKHKELEVKLLEINSGQSLEISINYLLI